ncbi:MAG: ABC transporter substrate-binding protein [Chloroflexia bacterium]|nr:ABC transporter substrate-binding protein [Chloroflexia bacterium]
MATARQSTFRFVTLVGLVTLVLACLPWTYPTQAAPPQAIPAALPPVSPPQPLQQSPAITIGVAAALSGPAEFLGWAELNAVQLAVSQTNAAGGLEVGGQTYQVVLVAADSGCNPTQAITAANALLDAGAAAVVGHTCSSASMAAQPLYYAAGVPMVSPSSTAPPLTEQGYDTTFRVVARDDASATRLAYSLYNELGLSSAAVIERTDSWMPDPPDAFEAAFTALGGTITSRRQVTSTADFGPVLAAIQPENPQAIYYADDRAGEAGLLSRMAHDLGMDQVVMAWDGVNVDRAALGTYVNSAGPAAAGDLAGLTQRAALDMPGYPAFSAAYRAAGFANYGDDPGAFGAFAYDDARIILRAIQEAGSVDPGDVRDEIAAAPPYAGIVGDYEGFDALGDVIPQWCWVEPLSGPWMPLGGPGAAGGIVEALAARTDVSGTLYAAVGSPPSGTNAKIYRSTDGAASWTPLYTGTERLGGLAVSGTLVYAAGQGDYGWDLVLRSGDGGDHWTPVLTGTEDYWTSLHSVAIHPLSPTAVYAAGSQWWHVGQIDMGVVYRTLDDGASWTQALTVPGGCCGVQFNALDVAPLSPTTVFAAGSESDAASAYGVIYRTVDGGENWTRVLTATQDGGELHFSSLLVHPLTPTIVYAGTGWGPNYLYRSEDGGLSWSRVFTGAGFRLALDLPDTIYASDDCSALYRSEQGGDPGSWSETNHPGPCIRSLAVGPGPTPGALYAGADGAGLYKSPDGGDTWWERNEGLWSLIQPWDIDPDPQDPAKLLVATNGCMGGWLTTDGGGSWDRLPEPSCASAFAFNPGDSNLVYAGSQYECDRGSIWRSEDGGQNFRIVFTSSLVISDCSGGNQGIYDLAVAPSMTDTVYAAGEDFPPPGQGGSYGVVVRSLDGGLSWTVVLTLPHWSQVWTLAIDPTDADTVYAGGLHNGPGQGFVYRSRDGGENWTLVLTTSGTVRSIAIDGQKPQVLYVGNDSYEVFKSADGGDTWDMIRPCCPSGNRLLVDPRVPSHVYLAGWGYVDESVDSGHTWGEGQLPISQGLPNMDPAVLAVDNGSMPQTLYAGLSGVWVYRRMAPQPGQPVTITMWTDPPTRTLYANCLHDVYYNGLVTDLHGNWVADGTLLDVVYDMHFPDELVTVTLTKSTLDGQISGGYVGGIDVPALFTFTAIANVRATAAVTVTLLYNPPAAISITQAPFSLTVDGEAGLITASLPGLHDGCASSGTAVSWTTSLGSVPSRTLSRRGVATATLASGGQAGLARVTAWAGGYSDTVEVEFVDLPLDGLSAANDSPTALGGVTTLTATVGSGSNAVYTWDLGDGTAGAGAVLTHTYPGVTTYTAVVTASNGVSQLSTTTVVAITAPTYWSYLPLVLKNH